MIEIKAPNKIPKFDNKLVVFLAGSIEMGKAKDWQSELKDILKDVDVVLLNPRRDNWDTSWEQSASNPKFKEQVEWELNGLEQNHITVMYFQAGTKSPITLLELGLRANYFGTIVYCEDEFWRKGNIDVVCDYYDIKRANSLQELADYIVKMKKEILGGIFNKK